MPSQSFSGRALASAVDAFVETLESRRLLHGGFGAFVNFQPAGAPVPSGYVADSGAVYGARGNGYTYGWDADNSANTRDKDSSLSLDQRYDTFNHMQKNGGNRSWQIEVPNGTYDVHIVSGDAGFYDSVFKINVEGQLVLSGTPTSSNRWVEGTATVNVTDGKLSVTNASGSSNNKIDFIDIEQHDDHPKIAVHADDANAAEVNNDTGSFTLTRSGDTSSPLTVSYVVAGTASNGVDYQAISSFVTFDAGQTTAKIAINPIDDKEIEGEENVVLTLSADDAYEVDPTATSDSVTIADDEALGADGNSPIRINFQPADVDGADFYKTDYGATYGKRANGLTYGWSADNTANTRDRDSSNSPDQRYDTLIHMQKSGSVSWNIAVPNGTYTVRVVSGDAGFTDSIFKINVEGVLTVNGTPSKSNFWVEGTKVVTVSDGNLTVSNASGASNNKIAFIEIMPGAHPLPVVGVNATKSDASENGSVGRFSITRLTDDWSQPLTVNYTLGGTAKNGIDYASLSGSVTIAAGQPSATVTVNAIDDSSAEGGEYLTLSLSPNFSYSNAFNESARVNIADNDVTGTLSWATKASSPVARSEGMGAVVGNKLYAFGGYKDSTFRPVPDVYAYDFTTNTWTKKADMPQRLTHAGTATDGTFIYMAGGYPGLANQPQTFSTTNVWKYNPSNDTWSNLKPLPSARGGGTLVYNDVDNHLYFVGGSDSSRHDSASAWKLDLSNQSAGWIQLTNLPQPRNHVGGAALNGKIYVVGGQTGQDNLSVFKSNVYEYTPSSNSWREVAPLINQPRSHIANATFVYNGKIVVEGGEGPGRVALSNVETYDPSTNQWTALTNLKAARSSGIGAVWDDHLFFTTGYNGAFKSDTWLGTFG
jgi:N-acetylneuraminic acid mutarotase